MMTNLKSAVSNKERRKQLLKKITNTKTVSPSVKAVDPCIWIRKERDQLR